MSSSEDGNIETFSSEHNDSMSSYSEDEQKKRILFQNVAPLPRVFPSPMMNYITKDPPKTADIQRKLMQILLR